MRIVIALGGNALLRRGEPLTADNQRHNVKAAALALAPLARDNELIISHGNGPQVGLLALQGLAYKPGESYPLDILDAETEGMIGYLIEQELTNLLPPEKRCATLLTQIEVDPNDPAFKQPAKPIGPLYSEADARKLAQERNWTVAPDTSGYRRVVASPRPQRILELSVIELLVNHRVVVICAGGGGIPVIRRSDGGLVGIEAVIDKDFASALLAKSLHADALLMLTDVNAVYQHWNAPGARALRRITPQALTGFSFAAGSMRPKVQAGIEFVAQTGGIAGIGKLEDAQAILRGEAGTVIAQDTRPILWWDK
ncbi:MAG TPA: carbamate kinase [Gammaproteobacteria bacterium]